MAWKCLFLQKEGALPAELQYIRFPPSPSVLIFRRPLRSKKKECLIWRPHFPARLWLSVGDQTFRRFFMICSVGVVQ